ncbi:MAG: FHA domain-containing protein [Myxococcota bacterium]
MFNRPYRLARQAEGAGKYREAATLYVEAELYEEAANALLFHAARTRTLDERLQAYEDALRWLPNDHPRRRKVHIQYGLALVDDAQRRGVHTAEERRRLAGAARRLEKVESYSDAATAYELLGRTDDMARCLELGGEIERLEALLEESHDADQKQRQLRTLIGNYEMSTKVGDRREAQRALRTAVELAPEDPDIASLLRRLEARFPSPFRLDLEVDGAKLGFVGRLPVTLGRSDAHVIVRGASVSRKHTELRASDGNLTVRDLDSRNGTLIRGLPIAGEVRLTGPTEVGLGDDVTVALEPAGPAAIQLEVTRGLDHGTRVVVGTGALAMGALPFRITFPEGYATLEALPGTALILGTQNCALPVVLLRDDSLTVGSHRIRVL